MVPLGYYKDPEKSARTFREVNGVRYAFPGDMATVAADGTLVLLGRGSNCINTGGEKVFPEEVEEALKVHSGRRGCPRVRRARRALRRSASSASCRSAPGSSASTDDIVADARARLSSYKLPRDLRIIERVPRTPSGKPDYPAARQLFG